VGFLLEWTGDENAGGLPTPSCFFVILVFLPYGVYYLLATQVDMSEDTAERIGISIYGVYALLMVGILARAFLRMKYKGKVKTGRRVSR